MSQHPSAHHNTLHCTPLGPPHNPENAGLSPAPLQWPVSLSWVSAHTTLLLSGISSIAFALTREMTSKPRWLLLTQKGNLPKRFFWGKGQTTGFVLDNLFPESSPLPKKISFLYISFILGSLVTKHWHDLLWRLLMVSQKWSRVSWLQYGCCSYYIRGKRGLYFILLFYWEITNTRLKPQILNVEWDLMIIVTHVITIHPNTIENISSSQKVPTHPFPTKSPQFQTHAFWFPAKVN